MVTHSYNGCLWAVGLNFLLESLLKNIISFLENYLEEVPKTKTQISLQNTMKEKERKPFKWLTLRG